MRNPSWAFTGNLNTPRYGHTATLLANGKVLVVGGLERTLAPFSVTDSAELYDPATGTWSRTGNLNTGRIGHTATLLPNGKVLVAGGRDHLAPPFFGLTDSVELYDPATGTWSNTGNLNTSRSGHTATLLANGQVLVAGGVTTDCILLDSAELYDPATGMWTLTGSLRTARSLHLATLLPSDNVLVAGGYIYGSLTFLAARRSMTLLQGAGAAPTISTDPGLTRQHCCPLARPWSLNGTARSYTTRQQGYGASPTISMRRARLTQQHCFRTVRSWSREATITMMIIPSLVQSSMTQRQGSGAGAAT